MSHPAVHPVGVPPIAAHIAEPRGVTKDVQGMAGTLGSLALRLGQFGFALISFCVMVSIEDFASVTAFRFLVGAMVIQCLWSFSIALLDGYALLLKRSFRKSALLSLFVIGDWVTSTLTLAAACSSAGITVLVDNDLGECGENHCGKYESAVAMTFLTWGLVSPSFFLSFILLATR